MKILDSNFRKELYKGLMEAGYEKQEAQKIVGVKYFKALKEKVQMTLSGLSTEINDNQFNPLSEEFLTSFNADIAELQKMNEYVNS
jgi:hypothetical protein